MTNEERIQKTISLEKTDKILSGPAIMNFAATYAGITLKEYLYDEEKAEAAYEKSFNELGGWDLLTGGMSAAGLLINPMMKAKVPGRDLPDNVVNQFLEEEIMLPEDYDFVIDNGYNALVARMVKRMYPDRSEEEHKSLQAEAMRRGKAHTDIWAARGLGRLGAGEGAPLAFARFCYYRSLAKFALDVRRMPDKLRAACKACIPDLIANSKKGVETTGIRRTSISGSRASATFISQKQFEQFVWPDFYEIVTKLAEDDIDTIFHFDTDWTPFLHYFKELPRGRSILQCDGATDIFKAKEVLRDHMAIMGDVPPGMLSLGSPEEVYDYCKKLIEVVGEGGGFILSSGCETPFNSKPENVAAMVRAGNELTWN
jgi:hypothetical protein